jgi:hypothetical protein
VPYVVSVDKKNISVIVYGPMDRIRKIYRRAHMHAPLSFLFNPVLSAGVSCLCTYILGKLAVEVIKGARS